MAFGPPFRPEGMSKAAINRAILGQMRDLTLRERATPEKEPLAV